MKKDFAPRPEKIIETERLTLRYRFAEDAKACFQLIDENRKHLKPWMPWEKSTLKVSDTEDYFSMARKSWDIDASMFDFSIFLKSSGKMIGSGGLHSLDWEKRTAEIGYWIGAEFQGQGYILEAVKKWEQIALGLGFHRIKIVCDRKNHRSRKIASILDFRLESIEIDETFQNGKLRDTVRYAKILNPKVPGYITKNFPKGYGLKKVDEEEFLKVTGSLRKKASLGSLALPRDLETPPAATEENFEWGMRLCYVIYFENQVIGYHSGFQDSRESFCMASSYIDRSHQGRKLYVTMLDEILKDLTELGFQRVWSDHQMTQSKIISTKLRRGFVITGTTLNLQAGTLVRLTYFTNKLRKKVLKFRSGQISFDDELKKVFKI